jgi:chromosome segregation ATPase
MRAQGGYRLSSQAQAVVNPSNRGGSSDAGSVVEENPLAGIPKPSSHIHGLASHIVEYEQRCEFLEQRNLWLTKKLMDCQRNFVERTLATGPKQVKRKAFKGWCATMTEMRLERQLHDQTSSLDQCQQVARELGSALTEEQQGRAATDMQHRTAQKQLEEANAEGQRLMDEYQSGSNYLESMEKLVRDAEGCLNRARVEAMAVAEHANRYEARVRELTSEVKDRKQRVVRPGGDNALEYANTKRDEAHGVMQQVSHLLPARGNPENERM